MRNFKKILILSIPLILYYIFYNFNTPNQKIIKVPPIVIESNYQEENRVETIANIILSLKRAIDKNKKSQKINKKEEAKKILESLKKSIPTQSNIASKQIKKVTIPKRVVKKHLYKKAKKKVVKKIIKVVKIIKKDCNKIEKSKVKQKRKIKEAKVHKINNLTKKIEKELNNNKVIDIKTATTDDFKDLPFVKPIEIIKISKPFEASSITSID